MSACCAGNYNLCIQQGATFKKFFTWLAGYCGCSVGGGLQPVDLTGYTASLQIRAFPLSPTVLYDATTDLSLYGTSGIIELNIPAADTALMTWWTGVYDLFVYDSSGNATKLLSGNVSVCPAVTAVGANAQFVLVPGGQAADLPGGQGILTP